MFSKDERWKSLWANETRPKHAVDDEVFYRTYARELLIVIGDAVPDEVLEIGCGTGALYPFLNFDKSKRYRGVDVSNSMLSIFRDRFPEVDLIVSDGESYQDNEKYNLIFSNAVVQNFTPAMLDEHLAHAKTMLKSNGRIVHAMIPWRPARYSYCYGSLLQSRDPGIFRYLKLRVALWKDGFLGQWYDAQELAECGKRHRLKVKFYGSLHYPYRIHAEFGHLE